MTEKRKGKLKHGIYSFIQKGKLTGGVPGLDAIRTRVRAESNALNKRYGDEPALMILCRNQVYCDTVLELAIAELSLHGVLDQEAIKKGEIKVRDIVRCFATFLNSSRLNILALEKLSREGSGDEVFDVVEYAAKKYGGGSDE